MEALSPLERKSFRYDVKQGYTNVSDLDRVLQLEYPDLVAKLERFNRVAGEILAQDVSATTDRFLKDIGVTA